MNEMEDKNLIEVEAKIKEAMESIELEPFDDMMARLRPKLKKKRQRKLFMSKTFIRRLTAVAASFILLLGVGLTLYFNLPRSDDPPVYRYEDEFVSEPMSCDKADITAIVGLYVPNLSILFNESYLVAKHKVSGESVYFIIEGYHAEGETVRHIVLTLVVQKKYPVANEGDYNTENKITVAGKEISVLDENNFADGFFSYKLGFKVGDARYYMDYRTMSQTNDAESFLQLFLS